jgi:AAHS family benzoate transporter-like MFS transporter
MGGSSFGVTETGAGAIASCAMAGTLAGGLGAARFSRRHSPRPVLAAVVWILAAGFAVCALAPLPEVMGAGRFLTGLGVGAAVPTAIALTATVAPPRRRAAVHTLMFSGLQLGSAVGALTAPPLLAATGWRAMFAIGAGGALLLSALIPRLVGSHLARATVTEPTGLRALWAPPLRRTTLTHWSATALGLLVIYGLNTWLVQLMSMTGLSTSDALRLLTVFSLGAVLGSPLAGVAADRWGHRRTTVVLFVAGAVSLALLARHPPRTAVWVLVLGAGLGTMGATTVLNAFTAASHPEAQRTTALGWALGIGRLGAIAGPAYGGFVLSEDSTPGSVLTAFALPTLLAGLVIAASPSVRRDEPDLDLLAAGTAVVTSDRRTCSPEAPTATPVHGPP